MVKLLSEPYIIYGIFTDRGGSAVVNATVTAKNLATADELTVTTNSSGQFAIDCANFENGYEDGDTIKLYGASSSSIDYELYLSVDGGTTWQEVNNNVTTKVLANSNRIKVDQTQYPGGRVDLDVTLIA